MTVRKVIIFGPTGAVGSSAARAAHDRGAQVILAMRDPSKPIPQLEASSTQDPGVYQRVQADLTQPDTVHAAVTQTGAQHAFVYIAFNSPDNMRSSIQALKDAGIQSVVLLSSFSVQGDLHAVATSDAIAFAHAQVEINLQDVFGEDAIVAVRPAFFASNSMWWASQIVNESEVRTSFPSVQADFISPDDIGAVAGTILAGASPVPRESTVNLVGPESLSVQGAIGVVAKALGKEVKVTKVSEEECVEVMITKAHLPPPVAQHLVGEFAKVGKDDAFLSAPNFQAARGNIERYLERPPTRFHEWVELHKDQLGAAV